MTAVFNFLMIIGAVQGFVFNVATFLSRKKIERPVLFLNLFVFFLSLNNLQSWVIDKGFLPSGSFWGQYSIPWYVLIVPMFYAFLIYYLEIGKKRLPFIIISVTLFLLELAARTIISLRVYNGNWHPSLIEKYNIIEDILTFAYSLFLFFKAVRLVYNNGSLFRPILAFDDLKWLKRFLAFGGGVFVLWILAIFFNLTEIVAKPYSYYPLRIGSSVLIYWAGYQAFFRYVVLKDRIVLRKEIRNDTSIQKKGPHVESSNHKSKREEAAYVQIHEYVLDNQRYLDPNLGMEGLAEELRVGTSRLSLLINSYSGANFPDYINRLRVEKAKKILMNPNFSAYTIVAIGLECGFNSKSTFYSAFKKFTGRTPSQYKSQQI